jgi:hypothetical protein
MNRMCGRMEKASYTPTQNFGRVTYWKNLTYKAMGTNITLDIMRYVVWTEVSPLKPNGNWMYQFL